VPSCGGALTLGAAVVDAAVTGFPDTPTRTLSGQTGEEVSRCARREIGVIRVRKGGS
jgi:hypothetical protein